MPASPRHPSRSRWTSFVADTDAAKARALHEEANPAHRLRVEHNADTLLVHLSDEDGKGWTIFAVDRGSRRWAVAQGRTQVETAKQAFDRLYEDA